MICTLTYDVQNSIIVSVISYIKEKLQMKFSAGSKVEPLNSNIPVHQLITPGHTAHARMLYSEGEGEKFYKPYKVWCIATAVLVAAIVYSGPNYSEYLFNKVSGIFNSESTVDPFAANSNINKFVYASNALNSIKSASRGDTGSYFADANEKGLLPGPTVGISSSYQEIYSYAKDSLVDLKAGKSLNCIKTADLTSKPWHNGFNFEAPLCTAVLNSPTPHQWVFSVYHSRFDEARQSYETKPWLGLFYKRDGVWSYTEIDLNGRSTQKNDGYVGVSDVFESLKADFPNDKKINNEVK